MPQQDVQNFIYNTVEEYMPMHGRRPRGDVPYPFGYIGLQIDSDNTFVEDEVNALVFTTVHLFGKLSEQATLNNILAAIKRDIRAQRHTQHYFLNVRNISSRSNNDVDGNLDLIHVVLEVEIQTS